MNMCNDPDILRVMMIIKIVYNIVTIFIPILLIILTTIDCSTCIINPDKLKELFPKMSRRFIAALAVFFIPTIIFGIIIRMELEVLLIAITSSWFKRYTLNQKYQSH